MELPELLQRVDELKAELAGMLPMDAIQDDRFWQKLRLEWNYNSNHIEGNTLTYGETFLLLVHGKTAGDHSVREIDEMRAHNVAINLVKQWASETQRPLREVDIRDLNKLLLKEPFWKAARTADGQETSIQIIPGEYKKQGNSVLQSDGTLFHYAQPEEVPAKMMELMQWYTAQSDAMHPLLLATEWHHRFILIHPFGDGNGRLARLIVNYILMRAGYMPLVVKSVDKGQYLTTLKKADAGDLVPFAKYLATQEEWALELAIRAAKGHDLEERGDWVKEAQARYERILSKKEQERKDAERKRELILESGRMNYPLIVQECERLVGAFSRFYNTSTCSVSCRVPYTTDKSLPLNVRQPMAKVSADMVCEWLKEDVIPFVVEFVIQFEGDALEGGIKDATLTFTWHFEDNQQRFQCGYAPDPFEGKPFTEKLLSDSFMGVSRSHGVSLDVEPVNIFESAGKWMLEHVTPKA